MLVDDLAHGPSKYMGFCIYNPRQRKAQKLPEIIPEHFRIRLPSLDETELMLSYDANSNCKQEPSATRTTTTSTEKEEKAEEVVGGIYRRIDIKYISFSNYYAALLYFTGSDNFNPEMRFKLPFVLL